MEPIKIVRLKDLNKYKTIGNKSILDKLDREYTVKQGYADHILVRDKSIHLIHPIMRYSHSEESQINKEINPYENRLVNSFIGNRKDYIIHMNAKYLNYLYEREMYNSICEYVYLTYKDLDYFIKIEFEGPRDVVFDYFFGKTGALKHHWFREQFEKLYDELLVHTVMKMRRASLPKFNPDKAELLTFIINAIKQIFVTGFIDKIKSPTVSHKMMDQFTDFVEDMDELEFNSPIYLHGFDLLLQLQASNETL